MLHVNMTPVNRASGFVSNHHADREIDHGLHREDQMKVAKP